MSVGNSRFYYLLTDDEGEDYFPGSGDRRRKSDPPEIESSTLSCMGRLWASVLMILFLLICWITLIAPIRLITSTIRNQALKSSVMETRTPEARDVYGTQYDMEEDFGDEFEEEWMEHTSSDPVTRVEANVEVASVEGAADCVLDLASVKTWIPVTTEGLFLQDALGEVTSTAGFSCEVPCVSSAPIDLGMDGALEFVAEEEQRAGGRDIENFCTVVAYEDILHYGSDVGRSESLKSTDKGSPTPRATSSSVPTAQKLMFDSKIAVPTAEDEADSAPSESDSDENVSVCESVNSSCTMEESDTVSMEIESVEEDRESLDRQMDVPMEFETYDENTASLDPPVDCDPPKDTSTPSAAEEESRLLTVTRSPREGWSESPPNKKTCLRDSTNFEITSEELSSMATEDPTVESIALTSEDVSKTLSVSSAAINPSSLKDLHTSEIGSAKIQGEDQVRATGNELGTTHTAKRKTTKEERCSWTVTRSPRDSLSESPSNKKPRLLDSINAESTSAGNDAMAPTPTNTLQTLSPEAVSKTVSISSLANPSTFEEPHPLEISEAALAEDQVPATSNEANTAAPAKTKVRRSIEIVPTGPGGQLSPSDVQVILSQGVSIEDLKRAVEKHRKQQASSSSPSPSESAPGSTPTVKSGPGTAPSSSGFWSGRRKKKILWLDGRYELYSSRESTPGRFSGAESDPGHLILDAVRRKLNYN